MIGSKAAGRSALERLEAVVGAIDDKAGVAQGLGDGGAEGGLVFDDQHRRPSTDSGARSIGGGGSAA